VDIGNTTTRVGSWDENAAEEIAVASTRDIAVRTAPPADLAARVEQRCGPTRGVALSSVVPEATTPWQAWAEDTGRELLVVRGDTPSPLSNAYRHPGRLGPDRWCAAVAAAQRLGTPAIFVLLGTATVVDAVSAEGAYLGGAIAIGVESGLAALHAATSALPKAEAAAPVGAIGRDTEESLRVGAVLGAAGLVEGLVRRMRAEIGEEAGVALSGGHAELLAPYLELMNCVVVPTLVLEGAGRIWGHNHA
jgi:type III pantothenate kinase